MTYVNKGSVEMDMQYFPEFEGLSNEQIAEKLKEGQYYVDWEGNVLPLQLPQNISEEIKDQWRDEDGSIIYGVEEMSTLWDYHNESETEFDKIKDEKAYFIVEG